MPVNQTIDGAKALAELKLKRLCQKMTNDLPHVLEMLEKHPRYMGSDYITVNGKGLAFSLAFELYPPADVPPEV